MDITSDIFVATTHKSPLFWLTLFLVGGTIYVADVLYGYIQYDFYKDGSDMIRGFIVDKRNAEGFNEEESSVKIEKKDVE
jgi:hypothetical protein